MALCALSDDELGIIVGLLRHPLEPHIVVAFSSASRELWAAWTQALRQQLRAEHEAASALCIKVGMRSCEELRESKVAIWRCKGLSAAELATLGQLGSVLPALEELRLIERSGSAAAGPDGVQGLAEGLSEGALPSVAVLDLFYMHAGDPGASALAAALGRGALAQLEILNLRHNGIGDAGLVALAPALRRLPALGQLFLSENPLADEGIAALVASLPLAGALPPPTGMLTKLTKLDLFHTQVTDAGCAALASALDRGALPVLENLFLEGIPASAAARVAVRRAVRAREPGN